VPEKKVESGENLKIDYTREGEKKYILRLFVAGVERKKSAKAISNLRRVCEEHLAGRYELEIIDILKQPTAALDEQIVATPTLIKQLPAPLRKLIGDMTNQEKVLLGIDLLKRKNE